MIRKSLISILQRALVVSMVLPLTLCTAAIKKPIVLPLSATEVTDYTTAVQQHVAATVQQLASIPENKKTYDNTLKPWNVLSKEILANFGALSFVAQAHEEVTDAAIAGMQVLQGFLFKTLVFDPNVSKFLLGYATTALAQPEQVTPFDSYLIESLLNSTTNVKQQLSSEILTTVAQLQELNAPLPKEPFLAIRGKGKTPNGNPLTILTLNTCFVPGELAFIHGGLSPWKERLAPLVELLRSTNADVVCLQEVHPDDATHELYHALKDQYSYFYGSIGPRFLGFDLSALGLPSGLFVASKYPIEKPEFSLYKNVAFPMNYGVFDFIVTDGKKSLAHVYTTHMQSLNQEGHSEVRAEELQQVLEKMSADIQTAKAELPYVLVGDFNIPWGTNEPGQALIEAHFYDDYNTKNKVLDRNNATWTDYYTWWYFNTNHIPIAAKDDFGTLDYALLLRSLPKGLEGHVPQQYTTHSKLVRTNDPKQPEKAISDHHALLITMETTK